MKKILSGLFAVVLLAAAAFALEPKLQEQFGMPQYYSVNASATSTHTVTGMVVSWSVLTTGGGCAFHIESSSGTGFTRIVSSTIYTGNGINVDDLPRARTDGGFWLSLDAVDAATTAYIDIGYLAPRSPGGVW